MDPIINHYLAEFIGKHPGSCGILIKESMEDLKLQKTHLIAGTYFVCSSTIKLHCDDQISIVGPFDSESISIAGGSLLAGKIIDLKSPKMAFVGTKEDPVTIIGLDAISIDSTEIMKIKNVVIYLLEGASFSFMSKGFSEFENVRVMKMRSSDGTLEIRSLYDWPTYADFYSSC